MSAVASNGYFSSKENISQAGSKVSTPASPLLQSTPQMAARSLMNKRGQNSPFPVTPTVSQSTISLEPPPGVQYMDFVKTWTDSHVAQWLADVKCGNLAGTFKTNDIRGDIILELDQVTLKEMGITSVGERLRIVNGVKILRQKVSSRTVGTPIVDRSKPPPYTAEARIAQPDRGIPDAARAETAPASRLARSGRPAPLQLNPNASRSEQLPRIEPDSARSQTTMAPPPVRPLPNPTQQPGSNASTPNVSHTIIPAVSRTHLPPLPPPPTSKPPPPPPSRPTPRPSNSNLNGRRTPTQGELTPSYVANQNRDLLTPSPAGGWSGYHLPADPRPGSSASKNLAPPRSTSPLPPGRVRPSASNSNLAHVRNTSLVNSPIRGSSAAQQLPPRPSTGNSHPYANAQPSIQQNLSPIAESFISQRPNAQGTPSPPNAVNYPGGRPNVPVRKLVKFLLPDEGLASTIDIATCAGGVEILERVLKKFGKASGRGNSDIPKAIEMEDGGLNIDGWCVCLGMGQQVGPGTPLREAELVSICNAPPDSPTREHGLIVRRVNAPANRRNDDRAEGSSQGQSKSQLQTDRNTKRASSISILSSLGVRDPEKALDPPSPTSNAAPKNSQDAKRPSKLRNFFGQRPPSELITTHLAEYFPTIEKKVLERTARQSIMMRGNPLSKRESAISVSTMPRSRFSSSTMGSSGSRNRASMAPSAISGISARSSSPSRAPSTISNNSLAVPGQDDGEAAPRVSLSTDDGREVEIVGRNAMEEPLTPSRATAPQLLPPIHTDASFSSSFDDLTKLTQPASKRMSYMTELRSKRDHSDSASFMTVDEITEQVESRRASSQADDTEEWTQVESEDATSTAAETLQESETSTLQDELESDSEEDDEPEAFTLGGGNKWIKGALIGAGSFGKVYLGMDASNGMLMAVKQVELPTGSGPNQDKKKNMLNALEREIELLKNLQHPNIVQYLYSSIDEEFLNIFLEYVPGGSVTALLRNYGAFEEPLVKNFVRQILQGLCYLHDRDIIHRDIKGANILVDNRGGIKISDFGISKKVDDNLLTGNRVNRPSLQGSVFWMAPEVVKQSAHTQKADIWSVGCLVVEMLTGEHPWAQLTQMQAIFKIGSSAKPTIPSDISAEAQDFLRLTFEINHEARPSAQQLIQHAWMQKKKKDAAKTTS